ncbi:hypothetical protein EJB05_46335 [Eragrostis curvula]|uniref:Uncharacterized protein n=1 Tax=Eragrostis curvula TaxID=38414 RepID=A0A5J9TPV7_9POAL|nr:hypothetical protein EJB05_46335 [Eragrostis curvula]
MMKNFVDCMEEFQKFIGVQIAVVFIAGSLSVPTQKSVDPQSDCVADFSFYVALGINRYYLCILLLLSAFLACTARSGARSAGGLDKQSIRMRYFIRGQALVSVLFSAIATIIAVPTYLYFLQASTTLFSCLPPEDQRIIHSSFFVIGVVGIVCYQHFVRIALYAE